MTDELLPQEVALRGLSGQVPEGLRVGTCSWKYGDWKGLVYSRVKDVDFLAEYARVFDSVEVDQWFWSLFGPDKVSLPRDRVVTSYAAVVPPEFRFTVKAPNSLTLTHFYRQHKGDDLLANPHFLSVDVWEQFRQLLVPLRDRLGSLMLQFEYLNRRKMPGLGAFIEAMSGFFDAVEPDVPWGIEIRNPNYLKTDWFAFLKERDIGHVFCQGYYMPPIWKIYEQFGDDLAGTVVIRLMGPDRGKIEKETGTRWSDIVDPHDAELDAVAEMTRDLLARRIPVYVNVNNHYEGCAPLTIRRFLERF